MAITDLTNTTWNIPASWLATAGYGQFSINGTLNDFSCSYFSIGFKSDSAGMQYVSAENYVCVGEEVFPYQAFDNSTKLTFTITDGTDVNSSSLISWLETYGEQVIEEYTLRIDGVEVTDYDNVIVNGTSYKCKKQEESLSGSFIIRDNNSQIDYSFIIEDISNPLLFIEYNNVYDTTNSAYISCSGITSNVYLMPDNDHLMLVDGTNVSGGIVVENGLTYYAGYHGGGSN